ncbi:hypothetical protein EDB48_104181 [Vibrio crassostreae]|nr:hypothetical protein EDB48_104181 [Vibrio crassostreae]
MFAGVFECFRYLWMFAHQSHALWLAVFDGQIS